MDQTRPADDRYLSAAALHDAAGILRGVAYVLEQIDGVFAEDAATDARRVRELAENLARWRPHPAVAAAEEHPGGAPSADVSDWAGLLAVYFSNSLRRT